MSGGGGSSNTTTSTEVKLPAWHEPFVKAVDQQAYNISQQPYQEYGGTRVAPLDPYQQAGLAMTASRGMNNPLSGAAQQQATSTLRGDYLNPFSNPMWGPASQELANAYKTGIAAQTDAAFSKAGAYGLGNSAYNQAVQANQNTFANSLNKLAGDIYNNERQNQIKTLALYPQTNQGGYQDYQALIGAGDAQRSYAQDIANLGYQNWYDAQNYPYQQLVNYANLSPALLGNSGVSTATGPNPNKASPLAGAIGGATLGYAAGPALAGALGGATAGSWAGPVGALVGAGLGYALS